DLLPLISLVPAGIGWGWRHFIFGSASRRGYSVEHVVGYHPCPDDQRDESESDRLHRLKQLGENIQGLLLSMSGPGEQRTDRG
ncbi:MAG: hypothetical protein ACJ786_27885, partial [Catenulispora sp.]